MRRVYRLALALFCASLLGLLLAPPFIHAAPMSALPAQIGQQGGRQATALQIADIRARDPDVVDDFTRDNDNWELSYDGDGSIYYKSGQLRIAVDVPDTIFWTQSAYDAANFYLEADTMHHEGALDNQIAVIFGFIDNDNYYLYSIGSDGYYSLFQLRNDEWETLLDWTESGLIETGAGSVNTMGLLVEDNRATLLVNDFILEQVVLPTTDGVGIGFAAGAFDNPPVDVGLDELRIWQIDAAVESEPTPVRIPTRAATPAGVVTPTPTTAPTTAPTAVPTATATEVPPAAPTAVPTETPTEEPTQEPTEEPIQEPTAAATPVPTAEAGAEPTPAVTPTSSLGYAGSLPVDDPVIADIQRSTPAYIQEFDAPLTDWNPYISQGVSYAVSDGALAMEIAAPGTLGWSGLPNYPVNYYLEVDIATAQTQVEAEYGILYNYQSPQNFDFFAINNLGSYSLWRLTDNQWEELVGWTESPLLTTDPDGVNRIGLWVNDGTIALIANGAGLATSYDPQPASGGLALAAGTFTEGGLIVRFDNLALWDLAPDRLAEPVATALPPVLDPMIDPEAQAAAAARIAEIQATAPDFTDDFRRDTGAWDTNVDEFGLFFYERRALHIEVIGPDRSAWATYVDAPDSAAPLQDFYIEFDTTFITRGGDNATGLAFRILDETNYYLISVSENGYLNLVKRIDGDWFDLTPWTFSETIDTGENTINRIGVLAEGATLAITINDEVVTVAQDSDITAGALGLLTQAFSADSAEVSFDNIALWRLGDPAP